MTNDNEEPSAASGGSGVCPYVTGTVTRYCTLTPFTLTDAERSAIKEASEFYIGTRTGVALGGLLERLK